MNASCALGFVTAFPITTASRQSRGMRRRPLERIGATGTAVRKEAGRGCPGRLWQFNQCETVVMVMPYQFGSEGLAWTDIWSSWGL